MLNHGKKTPASFAKARWLGLGFSFLIASSLGLAAESPPPARPQSAPIPPSTSDSPLFNGYGFLLTTFSAASDGLNSFGKGNQTAPTSARLQSSAVDGHARATFQVGQSRVGAVITPSMEVRGKVEFDFVDFNKASPTVASSPRLRIVKIEYLASESSVVFFGQDWDVFSPLNPFTYNFVGNFFQAGNAGFMRQQLGLQHRTKDWTFSLAAGLPGNNVTDTDTNLELSRLPSFAMSSAYAFGKNRVGFSAIWTRIIFNSQTALERGVYGANVFADLAVLPGGFSIRAELNYGMNLANIGALTLGQGRLDASIHEWGAWMTARKNWAEIHGVFGGVGVGRVTNRGSVAAPTATDLGIERNWVARLGYDRKLSARLNAFVESAHYRTRYARNNRVHASSVTLGFHMPF